MQTVIISVIMCVIAIGVGVYGWWIENGPEKKDTVLDEEKKDVEKEKVTKES